MVTHRPPHQPNQFFHQANFELLIQVNKARRAASSIATAPALQRPTVQRPFEAGVR